MPANASTGEQNDSKGDRRDEKRRSFVALLFAFLALLVSPMGLNQTRNPPTFFPEWVFVIGASLFAIAFALWSSSKTAEKKLHVLLAVALLTALTALVIPLLSYYLSYDNFPWLLLVPLTVVLIVCGWKFHQKWLSVTCVVIAVVFIGLAKEAPQNSVPLSRTVDQITASVQDLPRTGYVRLSIKSAPGTRILDEIDLENIEIEGRVCRVLPVFSLPPAHPYQGEEQLQPNEALLAATYSPPGWSNTIDFGIRVPKWPAEAAASVTVPIPKPDDKPSKREYESEGGGLRLNVKDVRWTLPRSTRPEPPVLELTITDDRYGRRPWRRVAPRVRDQNGRTLHLKSAVMGDHTRIFELIDVPPEATELTIDIFTEEQREKASISIRFGRLPID